MAATQNAKEYVISEDVETGQVLVHGEDGETVYESTDMGDAEAYTEAQRGSRNYTVPILLIAGGALSVLLGVSPLKREPDRAA